MNIQGQKEFSLFLLLLPLPLWGLWSLYRPFWEMDALDSVFPLSILLGTLFWGVLGWLIIAIPLYFSRTITLDREGCCFRFLCFRRRFRWEELTVQSWENRSPVLGFSRWFFPLHGPGILINVKGRVYHDHWEAGAYCLIFHPMTSVFLRFLPPMGENGDIGYGADRNRLLAALDSFSQCPGIPQD